MHKEMFQYLTITKAQMGGYYVNQQPGSDNRIYTPPVLAAFSTVDEALAFIRNHILGDHNEPEKFTP